MSLQKGDKCPIFQLKNQFDQIVDITDYLGKQNIVIFFYPKDETPGCTKEACAFRDDFEEFLKYNCALFGISSDSVQKHLSFSKNHNLPYNLLADETKTVRKLFGVPGNLFGLLPGRVTYIINKNGFIEEVFNSQTNPLGHIASALKTLNELS
jgi:peroxiredoxin Q/BCP